jgi:hypothetical protein
MEVEENSTIHLVKNYFREYLTSYKTEKNRSIVISHCGTFSQDLINSLVVRNEELMKSSGDKKAIVKRAFSILIEGLQNIRIHGRSDEQGNQLSFLIVAKAADRYCLNFANLVDYSIIQSIESQIYKLNLMNIDEVKELYTSVLTESGFSEKGGAGLGFITMKMKSNTKLNYSILPLDDRLSLFSLEILLEREL